MSETRTEVAFVTGAGSGIGAEVARMLAARGAALALFDLSETGLETTRQTLAAGTTSIALVGDVTDDASVKKAVERTVSELGGLTTVAACAGIETYGDVTQTTVEDWTRTIAVNLTGIFITAHHTVPVMTAGGGGTFTAVASDAGVWGAQGFAAYCASKHGIIGLVRCMALDHGPAGVRSNVVCPGFVETPMADRIFAETSEEERAFYASTVPLGRFARPQEVAQAIGHLSSDDASYANGLVYNLDGGSTAGYFRP